MIPSETPPGSVFDRPAIASILAIDKAELLERIDGDRDFLLELVEIFRSDYPHHVLAASQAIDRGESRGVERAAHALKGALSTLAAKRATTTAADLEELGKSGVLNSAGTSLSRLVAEIEEALVSLDAISRERP
jgi:HPt (histidine-containing phosphotransfer) domain-containing protein